ncbi:MAG: hypothetical protein QOJ35_4164, partial [Solirubrobacteraceae bacterium]|nr:hypothetical protein [Solirubrobacteraceae bacterium]
MSAVAVATKPADESTDDLTLIAAVRRGDDRAFEHLFLRYQGRITAYVRGMVRDDGRAEDITQEVFISALRRIRETDREIVFKPWIYEIAKNACIDAFRRARHTSDVSYDAEDGLADHGVLVDRSSAPDAAVDTKLSIDNLCGAFGGLSQTHHDILVMREFEGLSYREIGDRLGLSRAAVESTLFRARRRLSEEYEELVSGERCVRVRSIVDTPQGRAVGLRDQRRMARHLAHCQPCRRYAGRAGVDLGAVCAPASRAARIAAFMPLPAFLRRRFDVQDSAPPFGQEIVPALHWTSKIAMAVDPATVSAWPKAIAAAVTVAVAGLGAGAAVNERDKLADFLKQAPALVGIAPEHHATPQRPAWRAPTPAPGGRFAVPAAAAGAAGRGAHDASAGGSGPATPRTDGEPGTNDAAGAGATNGSGGSDGSAGTGGLVGGDGLAGGGGDAGADGSGAANGSAGAAGSAGAGGQAGWGSGAGGASGWSSFGGPGPGGSARVGAPEPIDPSAGATDPGGPGGHTGSGHDGSGSEAGQPGQVPGGSAQDPNGVAGQGGNA